MGTTQDDVCLVIDMECFRVVGRQQCRELGFCSWKGDSGRVAIHPHKPFRHLTQEEKKQVHYITREIHGLSYEPCRGEPATVSVTSVVERLYREFAVDHRRRVAFKGGHVERDLLLHLRIPFLNLETLGCPKYEHLQRGNEETCGWHAIPNKHHCAMAECKAFFNWYHRYFHPKEEPMDVDEYPPTQNTEEPMDTS